LSCNLQLRVFANATKFGCEQDLPLFLLLRMFVSPVRTDPEDELSNFSRTLEVAFRNPFYAKRTLNSRLYSDV
ncbi:hypothetical protein Q8G50_31905, partial [Klebsiella pneumoniae]